MVHRDAWFLLFLVPHSYLFGEAVQQNVSGLTGGNMKAWLFLLCICIVVNNTSSYASSLWRRQVYIRMTTMFAFSISSAVLSLHKLLWKKEASL